MPEQPDLVQGQFNETEMKLLKQLADTYEPPEDVPCVVFSKREDADVWVELLHEGESDGAGLVAWSAQQKSRHRARSGTKAVHLQVLEFVRNGGSLSPDTVKRYDRGTYPVSTLERALTTPHVRQKLGIELEDGPGSDEISKVRSSQGTREARRRDRDWNRQGRAVHDRRRQSEVHRPLQGRAVT